jgi:hypothetical protein
MTLTAFKTTYLLRVLTATDLEWVGLGGHEEDRRSIIVGIGPWVE